MFITAFPSGPSSDGEDEKQNGFEKSRPVTLSLMDKIFWKGKMPMVSRKSGWPGYERGKT
jgi:hypothetical protein